MPEKRWAVSLPFPAVSLPDHSDIMAQASDWGYRDAWSAEVVGVDGFTPLAVTALAAPQMRLGIAIANVFTRAPGTLATHAAAMDELAPGRFLLGLGLGSPAIVERWNGVPYRDLMTRMREYVTILRGALGGDRISFQGKTVSVDGLKLERPPAHHVGIYVAALRERMLYLAGEIGDGVITNWLGADDVPQIASAARAGADAAGKDPEQLEVVCRIPVILDPPSEARETLLRREFCGYLNVPAYARFQAWLGASKQLEPMWKAWAAGDRKAAVAAVPAARMDELFVTGDAAQRREHVQRFLDEGVDVAVLNFITSEQDPSKAADILSRGIREMAPG